MPSKCIVPGCNSGYKSSKEKVHMFTVPKDDDLVALWQDAIPRNDLVVKPGHRVCEKHFEKQDISWNKVLLGPDGSVVGVGVYKIPRLKEGVLPSIFPRCPLYLGKKGKKVQKSSVKRKQFKEKTASEDESFTPVKNAFATHFSFLTIYDDDTSVGIPKTWNRHNVKSNNIKAIHFCHLTHRKDKDDVKIVCSKEITIRETLRVHVTAMGQLVDINKLQMKVDQISSVQEVEEILKIDNMQVCSGCTTSDTTLQIETPFTLQDEEGYVRHLECPLLLVKSVLPSL